MRTQPPAARPAATVAAQLLLMLLALMAQPLTAAAQSCALPAQPLSHRFDSGAGWDPCWQIHPRFGLLLSALDYTAPGLPRRRVLREIHLAALLIHYDDAAQPSDIIAQFGLGGGQSQVLNADSCPGDTLLDSGQQPLLCRQHYDRNALTRYDGLGSLRRHSLRLSTHATAGTQLWSTGIELSEDGMIEPSSSLSGRISRFTSNNKTDTVINLQDEYGQQRIASSASLLSVWRMDFAIDGSADDDLVEQVQFVSDQSATVRRSISVQSISTESYHQVAAEQFRGWRIRDQHISAASDGGNITRIGYYLDPQNAGYHYSSNRINWARYQFFVTEHQACERLAVNNQLLYPECGNSLDEFIDIPPAAGALATLSDPVTWYALSSRFVANSGDWPVISSRRSAFRLIPFDWSEKSPFSAPVLNQP